MSLNRIYHFFDQGKKYTASQYLEKVAVVGNCFDEPDFDTQINLICNQMDPESLALLFRLHPDDIRTAAKGTRYPYITKAFKWILSKIYPSLTADLTTQYVVMIERIQEVLVNTPSTNIFDILNSLKKQQLLSNLMRIFSSTDFYSTNYLVYVNNINKCTFTEESFDEIALDFYSVFGIHITIEDKSIVDIPVVL